ncbi:MAG: hypothetical protein RL661_1365 [Pseudomonadota bacterium]
MLSKTCRRTLSALLLLAGPAAAVEPAGRDQLRNTRYCEMLVVSGGPLSLTASVYNTLGLNDCPEDAWRALDAKALARQYDARKVILNGPRHFLMDQASLVNPGKTDRFGKLEARLLAEVELSPLMLLKERGEPYEEKQVKRSTRYLFRQGWPIHQLITADGRRYVMQSYSQQVDAQLNMASLDHLGTRLKLPHGWSYQTLMPTQDLILETNGTATVLQDDLLNTYQRVD